MKSVLLLLLALPAAAFGPPDRVLTQRATSGQVSAEFSYREPRDTVFIRSARLKIARAGWTLVDTQMTRAPCRGCDVWYPWRPISLRDLDGDSEPELLLDFSSGGAPAQTHSLIYRYDAASGSYARRVDRWGTFLYRLVDLEGDGRPEFRSSDVRFDMRFCPHVCSAEPIRIWRYDRGRLLDVTRSFRAEIEEDAQRLWAWYRALEKRRHSLKVARSLLAAWMADQALLGRQAAGWRALEAAYRRGHLGRGRVDDGYPAGRRYLAALRTLLRRTGYLR